MALFPHLPEVTFRLMSKIPIEHGDRRRTAIIELEMLPYAMAATYHSCLQVVRTQLRVVESVFREHGSVQGVVLLSPVHQNELSFALDTFLESARRAQNALTPFLRRAFDGSLPSSLSDVVKRSEEGRVVLPASISQLLLAYWYANGKRLKDYRDTSQHHSIVASDARVFMSDDGEPGLRCLLPSNPESKASSKLVYGEPVVHAVPYVREQLMKIVEVTYRLTRAILDLVPGASRQSVSALSREPLVLGAPIQGHRLFTEENTQQTVASLLNRLNADCVSAPPAA